MKTKLYILTVLSLSLLSFKYTDDNDETPTQTSSNNCEENIISITELEVIIPTTGVGYFNMLTPHSVKANENQLAVNFLVDDQQGILTVIVNNLELQYGAQTLSDTPHGVIAAPVSQNGYTYTTFYNPNGESSYPVNPTGTLTITDINDICGIFSGTVEMHAWRYDENLGEVRYSVRLEFKHVKTNNVTHQF